MVVALKPLHDAARVRRVVVSTYQATSGAGVAGSRDLDRGHPRRSGRRRASRHETFAHPIAFNLIPQIGSPKHQGYTSEEMKMVYETRKIMGDDSIQVCPTCVRVPVSNCHSESILVETERKLTVDEARKLFAASPGIVVVDDLAAKQYPMPLNCDGRDEVFIGRIREDLSSPNGLAFWCVSDNLRKGAATNAVQIAELLARHARLSECGSRAVGQHGECERRSRALRAGRHGSIRMRDDQAHARLRRHRLCRLASAARPATLASSAGSRRSADHRRTLRVAASGRTDAGVHALGQVVSFDTALASFGRSAAYER